MAPIYPHTVVIKPPAFISVVPNQRDLRILTEVGSVTNDKEFAWTFIGKDTFCVLSFIRKGGGIGDKYVDAGGGGGGGGDDCCAETWLEEVELLL
jgi:hypothetical protein